MDSHSITSKNITPNTHPQTYDIEKVRQAKRSLEILVETLKIGLNEYCRTHPTWLNARTHLLPWTTNILEALMANDGRDLVVVTKLNTDITLQQVDGLTLMQAGVWEFEMHDILLCDILHNLIRDVLITPEHYTADYIHTVLNYLLITRKDHHSYSTELAIEYIRKHSANISSELKFAAANCIQRFADHYSQKELLEFMELVILDGGQKLEQKYDQQSTITASIENILLHKKNCHNELIWSVLIYSLLQAELDSAIFKFAVRHLLNNKRAYPKQVVIQAACRVTDQNQGFFRASMQEKAHFAEFFKTSMNISVIEDYSSRLRAVLDSDQNNHIVFYHVKDKTTAQCSGTIMELWCDAKFQAAIHANSPSLDLACFLLKYQKHPAIELWNSTFQVPITTKTPTMYTGSPNKLHAIVN